MNIEFLFTLARSLELLLMPRLLLTTVCIPVSNANSSLRTRTSCCAAGYCNRWSGRRKGCSMVGVLDPAHPAAMELDRFPPPCKMLLNI